MAYIVVHASVLEAVCGWAISEGDENKNLKISWDYGSFDGATQGKVLVSDNDNVEAGYFHNYQVDRNTFLTQDLPALKLSNEIEEEDYTV